MRNNEIKKTIAGRVFYQFGRSTRAYLPNKPGWIVAECKATGRLIVFAASDVANRAQKVMDYPDQNPFYRERGVVELNRYFFWFSLSAISESVIAISNAMKRQLGDLHFARGRDVDLPGWRGYKVIHRPSGLYMLIKRNSAQFDLSAWYRKLMYNVRHTADTTNRVPVVALTTSYGVNGIRKEDFMVRPIFAAVQSEKDAAQILASEAVVEGTAKLMTKGIVPESQWELYKRLNPMFAHKR